jgi:2-dehydro-3-deoxygluconokinase
VSRAGEAPAMPDIVGIGEAMVELNQTTRDGAFMPGFGGDTSNAMIAAARCGARAGYFTAVGADAFGQSLMDLWTREGVDCSRVIVSDAAYTGIYFVTHGANGHEFSYRRAGSAASRMTETDIPADMIAAAKILHVSGISQAISSSAADAVFAAIHIARQSKTLVCYDTNLRLKLWPLPRARAIIHEAMLYADIALPGLDDAEQLTGLSQPDSIADFYLRLGAKIVALTLGRDGALIANAQRRERIASIPVKAVDATGAGDAFDGAFLAEYLASGDPFKAGRFANVAAGLSTLGFGAIAPLPTRAQIAAAQFPLRIV